MDSLVAAIHEIWSKLYIHIDQLVCDLHLPKPHVLRNTALLLSLPLGYNFVRFVLCYRAAIREQLRKAKEESFLFGHPMIRLDKEQQLAQDDTHSPLASFAHVLELNPQFCKAHSDRWSLVSLGEYLNSLRSNVLPEGVELPNWIQDELEAAFAMLVSKGLGPYMGAILLPMLGTRRMEGRIEALSNNLAATILMNSEKRNEAGETIQGGMKLDLFTLSALTNINQKMIASRRAPPEGPTSLDKMRVGEVGYALSFAEVTDTTNREKQEQKEEDDRNTDTAFRTEVTVPNPFDVSSDWITTIAAMEELEMEQTGSYSPEDRSFPEPQPVNQRLLPDLYYGWGAAQCTHTKREVIQNRLLAVLLNRLGYNCYLYENGVSGYYKEEPFHVRLDPTAPFVDSPADFIQVLTRAGHTVQLCPRANITTFGQALCVKENDGSWSNVPLAAFLDSGYESQDGRNAKVCMPHGGIDLDISGPIFGQDVNRNPRICNIQHYLAIEGLCGWHSNHNAQVPWIKPINCCEPWKGGRAIQAVRLTSLVAVVANAEATEMALPFGGYGLVGVCNDSAAFVEQVMEKSTNIYPLMSTARFLVHGVRRMRKLRDALMEQESISVDRETEDLNRLMAGMTQLNTDLHASLANCKDSARRLLHCLPYGLPFLLNVETKKAIEEILVENAEYERYS